MMRTEVDLDFHIRRFYKDKDLTVHFYSTFEELVDLCRRYPVNVIVMASDGNLLPEIEMLRAIKRNVFLSIVPVVLYHPRPEPSDIIAAYENGVEDFIYGDWSERLVEVRIDRAIERSRRDLSINPSTYLPGPALIDREINRLLTEGEHFAICYADLDNFKAFNDYYGYYRGDKIIRLTARIIKDTVFDLCREGFVGHVAGDDYIFIIDRDLIDTICSKVIKTFDTLIPYQYDREDRLRGHITIANRRGVEEDFPLLTVSIAVLVNRDHKFSHVGEISNVLAGLKKAVKQSEGSNYLIDRRGGPKS
jgi:diguanylate cyclase (GGDEF)-like protein